MQNADPADEKKSAKGGIGKNADPADEKKSAKGGIRESADPAGGKSQQKAIYVKMLTRPVEKVSKRRYMQKC